MFSLVNAAMDPSCSFLLLLHTLIRSLSSRASQPWWSFSFWLFPVISLCGPEWAPPLSKANRGFSTRQKPFPTGCFQKDQGPPFQPGWKSP